MIGEGGSGGSGFNKLEQLYSRGTVHLGRVPGLGVHESVSLNYEGRVRPLTEQQDNIEHLQILLIFGALFQLAGIFGGEDRVSEVGSEAWIFAM